MAMFMGTASLLQIRRGFPARAQVYRRYEAFVQWQAL